MVRKMAMVVMGLVALFGVANAEVWKVDLVHSSVGFTVKHLVVSKVHGQFTEFEGEINYDGKDLSAGSVTFTIQAKSIDTDNDQRDEHLRNSDFLAVDSFPTLTFTSTKITPGQGENCQMTGNMTMRGVTKEVIFDCTANGIIDAFGGTKAGFSATATINRQDFGVHFNKVLEAGGLAVGDDVKIMIEIEATKAQ